VYECLEKNIATNNQGIPVQVLLHNQLQLRQAIKACRILVPFLKKVDWYLTLAREHRLGRDPECNSMDTKGVHIRRAEKKGTELLLVDID
jgi:hypothetical protein